jgi:hypothetical protein
MKERISLVVDGLCQVSGSMRRGINQLIFVTIGFLVWGCSELREITPEDAGVNYYPLRTGLYNIYQVNGVEYINARDSTVFAYYLKESVVDSFQNLESGISYKILREVRENSNDAWETDSVWTVRKDNIRVIRTENNIPIINLVFPVSESKTWDANGLNDRDADNYEMVEVGKPYAGEFVTFDQTVTVMQEDIPDIYIAFLYRKEIYAQDVGLVYKENIKLKFKQGDDYGNQIVDSGIRYFQSIIAYGQE